MQLKRLVLEQVYQHEHIDWTFQPGVTGILGANAKGKSNAMKAAYACLTNDFSRNPGTRLDAIRDVCPEGQKSFITTEWQHHTPFTVTRSLKPDKHRLVLPDEPELTTAKTIETRLNELLGHPKEVLDSYVFIQQWQLAAFLSARPAERAKLFAHLCNTVVAEQLWNLLGEQLRTDLPLIGQETENPASIKRQLLDYRKAEQAEVKRVNAYNKQLIVSKDERVALRKLIAAAERATQLLQDQQEKRAAYKRAKAKREPLQAERDKWAQTYTDMQQTLAGLEPGRDAARDRLAQLELLKQAKAQRESLEDSLAIVERTIKSLKPPVSEPCYLDEDFSTTLRERLTLNQQKLKEAEELVETFEETGDANCPTCGQSVKEMIDDSRDVIFELHPLVDADRKLLAGYDAWRIAQAKYERQLEDKRAQRKQLVAQLNQLGPVEIDEADIKKFNQAISSYNYRYQELTDAQRELRAAETNLTVATTTVDHLWAELRRIKKKLEAHTATPEEVTAARTRLSEHDKALEGRTRAKEMLEQIRSYKADCEQRLAAVEAVRERSKAARAWTGYLEEARSVLQRDSLPRMVHESYLAQLVLELNNILESFDTPFRVRSDEGLTLLVQKPGGRERDAAWLSGGETMVLAISFMLAVNQLFAREIGMLVLDEPTVAMDDHNLGCLDTMLANLARRANEQSWQIILITHEKFLSRAFDHVIQL